MSREIETMYTCSNDVKGSQRVSGSNTLHFGSMVWVSYNTYNAYINQHLVAHELPGTANRSVACIRKHYVRRGKEAYSMIRYPNKSETNPIAMNSPVTSGHKEGKGWAEGEEKNMVVE
jgi:hypothetical protein